MQKDYSHTHPNQVKSKTAVLQRKNISWILFIGFNIMFPIAFLVALYWMRTSG